MEPGSEPVGHVAAGDSDPVSAPQVGLCRVRPGLWMVVSRSGQKACSLETRARSWEVLLAQAWSQPPEAQVGNVKLLHTHVPLSSGITCGGGRLRCGHASWW